MAKQIGVHRSSLNDIENGKIKKIDIEILRKLAEELDLNLELLFKAARYDEFLLRLKGDSLDNNSTRDLKNLIKEYKKSELDLLEFDYQKRRTIRSARQQMKIMKDHKERLYTLDKAIEDMQSIFEQLEMVEEKYDYNKLPKDHH